MAIDVTDATFDTDVIERSKTTPVVVDLWATVVRAVQELGPILEKVIDATDGKVVLAKVDVDENPGDQPGVPGAVDPGGLRDEGRPGRRRLHGRLSGALRAAVRRQAAAERRGDRGSPSCIAAGDEASLRIALETEPGNEDVIAALAELLVDGATPTRRWPCSSGSPRRERTRKIAAAARVGVEPDDDYDAAAGRRCSTG